MTVEKLHDAIGLLPADLIAEADEKRNRKPKVIQWKRYAAMAACFVLVLGSAWFVSMIFSPKGALESMKEMAADAAPMEQAVMDVPAAAEEPAAAAPEAQAEEEALNGVSGSGSTAEDDVYSLPTVSEPAEVTRDTADSIRNRVETPLKPTTACFSSSAIVTLIHSRTELEDYLAEKDWIYDFSSFPTVCEGYDEDWFAEHDLLLLAMLNIPSNSNPRITALNQNENIWELCFAHNLTPTEEEPTFSTWHFLVEVEKDQIPDEDSVVLIFE